MTPAVPLATHLFLIALPIAVAALAVLHFLRSRREP